MSLNQGASKQELKKIVPGKMKASAATSTMLHKPVKMEVMLRFSCLKTYKYFGDKIMGW